MVPERAYDYGKVAALISCAVSIEPPSSHCEIRSNAVLRRKWAGICSVAKSSELSSAGAKGGVVKLPRRAGAITRGPTECVFSAYLIGGGSDVRNKRSPMAANHLLAP